jgi:hypothetical protein
MSKQMAHIATTVFYTVLCIVFEPPYFEKWFYFQLQVKRIQKKTYSIWLLHRPNPKPWCQSRCADLVGDPERKRLTNTGSYHEERKELA